MEDGYTTRHTFPAQTTIGIGEFFVLFGGGSVDNFNGNSQVSSTGGLGLNNGGDDVIIKNTAGVVVVTVTYSGATDQSICRDPDFTGEFVGHLSHSTNARVFSPGLTNDTPLSINNYQNNLFSGPHPSGNVGVQIHHIDPVNKNDIVWSISPYGLIQIGRLFNKGIYDSSKIISLNGSCVDNPKYFKCNSGFSVKELISSNVNESNFRVISGNVLTGTSIGSDGYLSLIHI